jgi:hypothetical protein
MRVHSVVSHASSACFALRGGQFVGLGLGGWLSVLLNANGLQEVSTLCVEEPDHQRGTLPVLHSSRLSKQCFQRTPCLHASLVDCVVHMLGWYVACLCVGMGFGWGVLVLCCCAHRISRVDPKRWLLAHQSFSGKVTACCCSEARFTACCIHLLSLHAVPA